MRIVAISVDPPEVARKHADKQGYTFTFLSDPKGEVIRRYDLLHERASKGGSDIARPAEFLLDSSGTIRWRNLTEDFTVRVKGEDVLKALDGLEITGGKASR